MPLGTVQEDLVSCAFSDAARTQDKATVRDAKRIRLWIFRRLQQAQRQIPSERTGKNITRQKPIVLRLLSMNIQITNRDLDVFRSLEKLPFTTDQLLRFSQTFKQQFACQRILERRLKRLTEDGLLRRCYFAFPKQGRNPSYWRLTRKSHSLIHPTESKAKRSQFLPIGVSLHFHSHNLNEFLLRLLLAASEGGLYTTRIDVEKSLEFDDQFSITPDAMIELAAKRRSFKFFVELDTATERVETDQRIPSSIQKKLETYERYRLTAGNSFRVLFVTTSSQQRAKNILQFANGVRSNPAGELVYATHLPSVLQCSNCLTEPVFQNHQGQPVSIVR